MTLPEVLKSGTERLVSQLKKSSKVSILGPHFPQSSPVHHFLAFGSGPRSTGLAQAMQRD
jgi:hypothetical protein